MPMICRWFAIPSGNADQIGGIQELFGVFVGVRIYIYTYRIIAMKFVALWGNCLQAGPGAAILYPSTPNGTLK